MDSMENLRILQIISHLDNEHSGPTYSVQKLTEGISFYEKKCELLFLDRGRPKVTLADVNVKGFKQARFLRKLGQSSDMRRYIKDVSGPAICHSHGLWMMPNIYHKSVQRNVLTILSPRGTLNKETLKFSSLKKKIMWYALQKEAFHRSDALHATSHEELEDLRAVGFNGPIILLPNGIDVQPQGVLQTQKYHNNKKLMEAIYIGRIHPKKGLELLLNTWSKLNTENWKLTIYGTGDANYLLKIKNIITKLNIRNASLEAPVYGRDKTRIYLKSNLFILPSQNENFGNVVTESLASGTPVLTTHNTPWKILNTARAGWCVSREPQIFKKCLEQVINLPPEVLRRYGLRGHNLVEENFCWDLISKKMIQAYICLLNRSALPDFVFQ